MIHLWLGDTEVESFALSNPSREYDAAYTDAQQWANDHCHSVELWRYEGHETIDEGELIDTVWPQPVQLALMPGAEVVIKDNQWICHICGREESTEVDLLAHQFNSSCEGTP